MGQDAAVPGTKYRAERQGQGIQAEFQMPETFTQALKSRMLVISSSSLLLLHPRGSGLVPKQKVDVANRRDSR